MSKNLEVKARILDIDRAIQIIEAIPAAYKGELHQVDTYFNVLHGRLKLREILHEHTELIYYSRHERERERVSNFEIYPCNDAPHLKKLLSQALGIKAVVSKVRKLFMYKTTRIHVDKVKNLGTFLELETPFVLEAKIAKKQTRFLVQKFGIKRENFILKSYLDLIISKSIRNN